MKKMEMLKKAFPSVFTSANMAMGLSAIFLCFFAQNAPDNDARLYNLASWLVIAAIAFDGLDGKVARMTHTTSEFGIQYDSLSDLVVFGVAPSVLLYARFLADLPAGFAALPIFFTIFGAIRLARFNCTASGNEKAWFYGLPIPTAGGLIAAYVLFADFLVNRGIATFSSSAILYGAISLAILNLCLMVTMIKFDVFERFFFRNFGFGIRSLIVLFVLFALVRFPGPLFMALGALYILQGLIRWCYEAIRNEDTALEPEEEYEETI